MKTLLAPALSGHRYAFDGLSCYVAGQGPPLLLVHSVNAAASAAEVRPVYERFRATRTVVAIDLPGFGFSDRSDRDYSPRLMTDALHAAVAWIRRHRSHERIDALGLSLGCEFLARAAYESPTHFKHLAFVSPTGLDGRRERRGAPGQTREVPLLYPLLSQPLWGEWLFQRLTRPSVVRYFLERTYGRELIDETLWADAVDNARQPGAHHAPLHFLAGRLFSADIHRIYEGLSQPVWISHGQHGDFTDFRAMHSIPATRRWRHTVFPTGALPHFELQREFQLLLEAFLQDPASPVLRTSARARAARHAQRPVADLPH